MSRRGTAALGCAGVLGIGLLGIVALSQLAPLFLRPAEPPEPVPGRGPSPPQSTRPGTEPPVSPDGEPTPDPDRYLPYVEARHGFGRSERDGVYHLSYGFIDHHGKSVDVACTIDTREHARAVAAFGYVEEGIQAELNARLTRRVKDELAQAGLGPYVTVSFYGWGGYKWEASFTGAPGEELGRLIVNRDAFIQWMEKELPPLRERIEDELLARRMLTQEGDTIHVDYAALAVRSTPVVADCARALADAASRASDRRALGLFVAFLQEMKYEVPPPVVEGRHVLGVWVPSEVLVNDHGDCDSKAVTFCALWRHRAARSVVLELPGHALVAVEAKPGPGEHFIRMGNRYYVLCEVAGPGKLHPGERPVSGNYRYAEVPPIS